MSYLQCFSTVSHAGIKQTGIKLAFLFPNRKEKQDKSIVSETFVAVINICLNGCDALVLGKISHTTTLNLETEVIS